MQKQVYDKKSDVLSSAQRLPGRRPADFGAVLSQSLVLFSWYVPRFKKVLKRWKPFFGFSPFFRHSAVILFIFILFPLCVKFHISCASALDGFYSVFELAVRVPALKLVSFPCRLCKLNRLGLHRVNGRILTAVLSAI